MKGSPRNGQRQALPEGGKSDRELAREMGISQARVLALRQRAMKKIRRMVLADPELRDLAEEICGHPIDA